jgi:tRNA A37 methylthiotransferase MiaB
MKLNDKAFVAAVGCYAQLKPEELANVDGVDLVLGATEKFKITDYIHDLSKNDMGEVHSCEIAEADFYVGVIQLEIVLELFEKFKTVAIINVLLYNSFGKRNF